MQSSCQHRCTPFFWTPFRRIARQKSKPSVAVLLCAARTPVTPVNANCGERRGGRGRFAKRRTTGARRNGDDCLNAATVLIAMPWPVMTLASRNRTLRRFVGWVERSETHHRRRQPLMGIASLHPSYKSGTLEERANSDGPIDFVFEAHFRLNPDIAPCPFSRSTCRAVPFRDQDAALVQQPSS
jgi:hypothetical protein